MRRHRRTYGAVVVVLVACAGGLAWLSWRPSEPEPTSEAPARAHRRTAPSPAIVRNDAPPACAHEYLLSEGGAATYTMRQGGGEGVQVRLHNLGSERNGSARSLRWAAVVSQDGGAERRMEFRTPCDDRGVGLPWLVFVQRLIGLTPVSDDVRLPYEPGAEASAYAGTVVFGQRGGELIVQHEVTEIGSEQVTTPVGAFEGMRLDWRNEASSGGVDAVYRGSSWIAPGVGLLRLEERGVNGPTYSLELQSVERPS